VRLDIRDLSIRFRNGVQVLDAVDLTVASGEFVAIVGPSGCGKSTLLNAIAGLVSADDAEVTGSALVDGRDVRDLGLRQLNLGYVFQRDSLLPWRSVSDNIAAGLEIRGVGRAALTARIAQLLDMVGLSGFGSAYPSQLSGGMRQRAVLARTLTYDPRLILMDEPFGALDAQTRLVLQAELLRIWERTQTSIVFVTHDLAEAILLAQRVVLLSRRPGAIRYVTVIDLPQPRDPFALRADPRFGALETELWQLLQHEYRLPAAA
jgi:NitT/TauT family transport system ATP-binding protein